MKKERTCKMFIEDIIVSINKIEEYIKDFSYEKFNSNEMVVDAVIRNFEIIGEAVNNIPKEIHDKDNNIPWKEMKGLRNMVLHEYFGIDKSIIWEIANKDLAEVKPKIKLLLKSLK
ncbi:MAG: hypothetical protein A2539_00560 [Elusimicrobia bacterium RIFOXYD2_FULL_34_15]|nr:MAG: hypothetical protein A2539_00560 [Elusimicrobia bacterium RIFOXYD2_FULL_34_15]